jgi:hypothetical protein
MLARRCSRSPPGVPLSVGPKAQVSGANAPCAAEGQDEHGWVRPQVCGSVWPKKVGSYLLYKITNIRRYQMTTVRKSVSERRGEWESKISGNSPVPTPPAVVGDVIPVKATPVIPPLPKSLPPRDAPAAVPTTINSSKSSDELWDDFFSSLSDLAESPNNRQGSAVPDLLTTKKPMITSVKQPEVKAAGPAAHESKRSAGPALSAADVPLDGLTREERLAASTISGTALIGHGLPITSYNGDNSPYVFGCNYTHLFYKNGTEVHIAKRDNNVVNGPRVYHTAHELTMEEVGTNIYRVNTIGLVSCPVGRRLVCYDITKYVNDKLFTKKTILEFRKK